MQPLVSLAALERALSAQRLAAYRLPTDRDEVDGVARYLWNLALVGALQPLLHTLEITFRNELSRAAARLNEKRPFRHHRVRSWLDARPSMLLPHEANKVDRAKERLGADARSQTEGHLIAKLDFGFWVALCRQPYEDTRPGGPRLWPRALELAFRGRPADVTTRTAIHQRFDAIRQYRNRVAHHEPIWDRDYLREHDLVVDSLGWMSPKLADAVRTLSPAAAILGGGPDGYRREAEALVGRRSPADTVALSGVQAVFTDSFHPAPVAVRVPGAKGGTPA